MQTYLSSILRRSLRLEGALNAVYVPVVSSPFPFVFISPKVLTVDPERNRVVLTAKKTLLNTTFPILTSFSEAKVGLLTHAVIFRVTDKHLLVEFFNDVKAVVPKREARYDLLPRV